MAPADVTESHVIAARLAAASEVFPIARPGDFASTALSSAEGDVVTVTVTDRKGGGRREYRAVVQLVAECPTKNTPGRCANTAEGSQNSSPVTTNEEFQP